MGTSGNYSTYPSQSTTSTSTALPLNMSSSGKMTIEGKQYDSWEQYVASKK